MIKFCKAFVSSTNEQLKQYSIKQETKLSNFSSHHCQKLDRFTFMVVSCFVWYLNKSPFDSDLMKRF